MFGFKPELVIFCTLMSTQKRYIKDLSLADPVNVLLLKTCPFKKLSVV
jgi:hypothetical protein